MRCFVLKYSHRTYLEHCPEWLYRENYSGNTRAQCNRTIQTAFAVRTSQCRPEYCEGNNCIENIVHQQFTQSSLRHVVRHQITE